MKRFLSLTQTWNKRVMSVFLVFAMILSFVPLLSVQAATSGLEVDNSGTTILRSGAVSDPGASPNTGATGNPGAGWTRHAVANSTLVNTTSSRLQSNVNVKNIAPDWSNIAYRQYSNIRVPEDGIYQVKLRYTSADGIWRSDVAVRANYGQQSIVCLRDKNPRVEDALWNLEEWGPKANWEWDQATTVIVNLYLLGGIDNTIQISGALLTDAFPSNPAWVEYNWIDVSDTPSWPAGWGPVFTPDSSVEAEEEGGKIEGIEISFPKAPNAEIYYLVLENEEDEEIQLDKTTGTLYEGAFSIDKQQVANESIAVKAVAYYTEEGMEKVSPVSTVTYFVRKAAAPVFSLDPNEAYITDSIKLEISSPEPGGTVYYDIGSGEQQYTAPITLTSTTTVKAWTVKAGVRNSGVVKAEYTVGAPPKMYNDMTSMTGITEKTNTTLTSVATPGTGYNLFNTCIRMTIIAPGAQPTNTLHTAGITPQDGESFDASQYRYMVLYFKDDRQANDKPWLRINGAAGGSKEAWLDNDEWGANPRQATTTEWTKWAIPVSKFGNASTMIKEIVIGKWDAAFYHIGAIYFTNDLDRYPGTEISSTPVAALDVTFNPGSYTYNGTAHTPAITSVKNSVGDTLVAGEDYTISYENNIEAGGSAAVVITGNPDKGYTGTRKSFFEISPKSFEGVDVTIPLQERTGKMVEIEGIVVKDGNVVVGPENYYLVYDKKIENGEYDVTVKGKGSYVGSQAKKYEIVQRTDITAADITIDTTSLTYTGNPIEPAVQVKPAGESSALASDQYSLDWKNNTNAGTATVTVTMKATNEKYKGSVTKEFTIEPKSLTEASVTLQSGTWTYNGSQHKPNVTAVTVNGLSVPADSYVVSYSNNINAGTATVTVTGKSGTNYKDSVTKEFTIESKSLTEASVTLQSETWTYNGNQLEPNVTAVTVDGLSVPADSYVVSYSNNINIGTATVTVTSKSGTNYKDSVTKEFTIVSKPLTEASVTLQSGTWTYNGSQHKPNVTDVTVDGLSVSADSYVVSYSNNINAGTATVTVTGKPNTNFTGSVTANFKIEPKKISITIRNIPNQVWKGSQIKPSIGTLKDGSTTLTNGKDYDVKYGVNEAVGQGSVTVTFKGNYAGTAQKNFKINPPNMKKSGSKITPLKKKLNIKWKKVNSKAKVKYQVQCATNKGFTKGLKKLKPTSKNIITVNKLKANKKYFVRVRTYKKIGKTVYTGKWVVLGNKKTKK